MRSMILALSAALSLCGAFGGVAAAQTGTVPFGTAPSGAAPFSGQQPRSKTATNLPGQAGRPSVAPSLPAPDVANNKPSDFLRAAQGALATGHTGAAQQALEMAQTRMLDRSVPLGQTNVPSDNPTVAQISQALRDLGGGDRATAMRSIEMALASATAQGL